jgi:DNA-binding HxlR family transcriptional regulator
MPRSSVPVPNVLRAQCGTREVLDLIANKWTALVIHRLASGMRRYGELRREIEGISQKMLTQTLRGLERDGLVSRTVHPVVPPRVEYELTPLGQGLKAPLCALCHWAESHLDELHEARRRYADGRQ